MNCFRRKINQNGFTLIELIVVISIIAILATIAIPRFGGVTIDAQEKANLATARTIMSAIMNWEAENIDVFDASTDRADIEAELSGITLSVTAASPSQWGITGGGGNPIIITPPIVGTSATFEY